MKRNFIIITTLLCFSILTSGITLANETADKAKIKTVIKKAALTRQQAYANNVEYKGQVLKYKNPREVFEELAQYVSNKKGHIDKLKSYLNIKEGNEQLFRAMLKKRKYKNFDFKKIDIDNNSAFVEVDIFRESTTTLGPTTSVEIIRDENDNIVEVKEHNAPAHDIVTQGGYKHMINLELINNRWQIVEDKYDFLPEYRP